jgi:hypothetical protein
VVTAAGVTAGTATVARVAKNARDVVIKENARTRNVVKTSRAPSSNRVVTRSPMASRRAKVGGADVASATRHARAAKRSAMANHASRKRRASRHRLPPISPW